MFGDDNIPLHEQIAWLILFILVAILLFYGMTGEAIWQAL